RRLHFTLRVTRRLSFPALSSLRTATLSTAIYTLSLHDALPISAAWVVWSWTAATTGAEVRFHISFTPPPPAAVEAHLGARGRCRSEEHTSELQSRENLVCRLLLEKKKTRTNRGHGTES